MGRAGRGASAALPCSSGVGSAPLRSLRRRRSPALRCRPLRRFLSALKSVSRRAGAAAMRGRGAVRPAAAGPGRAALVWRRREGEGSGAERSPVLHVPHTGRGARRQRRCGERPRPAGPAACGEHGGRGGRGSGRRGRSGREAEPGGSATAS